MRVLVFLCVFLLEIFSTSYVQADFPYSGIKYHYVDFSSENRTAEVGWQYCEYTYNDADRDKGILIILGNDTLSSKIGFYCREEETCSGLKCQPSRMFYVFFVGICIICLVFMLYTVSKLNNRSNTIYVLPSSVRIRRM